MSSADFLSTLQGLLSAEAHSEPQQLERMLGIKFVRKSSYALKWEGDEMVIYKSGPSAHSEFLTAALYAATDGSRTVQLKLNTQVLCVALADVYAKFPSLPSVGPKTDAGEEELATNLGPGMMNNIGFSFLTNRDNPCITRIQFSQGERPGMRPE